MSRYRFVFDVTLLAQITIEASSFRFAELEIRRAIDGSSANLGSWPNGDPIVTTVAIEGELDLAEPSTRL